MTPEEFKALIEEAFKKYDTQINTAVSELKKLFEGGSATTAEMKKALDAVEIKMTESNEVIAELEQKAGKSIVDAVKSVTSIGAEFVACEGFKSASFGSGRGDVSLEVKNTITGQDDTVWSQRLPGIVAETNRPLVIRDILPATGTSSNSIEYMREKYDERVLNAAEVAETAEKPESAISFEMVSQAVATVAHWIKVTVQLMSDSAAVVGYINNLMAYGVAYRIDEQLLNGDGLGVNIKGLLHADNHIELVPVASDSAYDTMRKAITAVTLNYYAPTAVIMNPGDVQDLDLAKNEQGDYIANRDPSKAQPATVWGLPVVQSAAMPLGDYLLGNFPMCGMVFGREATTVRAFEQDEDNVQKNLVTIRAEARLALAVWRSRSLVGGSLVVTAAAE